MPTDNLDTVSLGGILKASEGLRELICLQAFRDGSFDRCEREGSVRGGAHRPNVTDGVPHGQDTNQVRIINQVTQRVDRTNSGWPLVI